MDFMHLFTHWPELPTFPPTNDQDIDPTIDHDPMDWIDLDLYSQNDLTVFEEPIILGQNTCINLNEAAQPHKIDLTERRTPESTYTPSSSPSPGKRRLQQDEQSNIGTSRPNKKIRPSPLANPGIQTLGAFHQFQRVRKIVMKPEMFTSICAYLHLLLRWHCPISTSDLDNFVVYYRTFLSRSRSGQITLSDSSSDRLVYYRWLAAQQFGSKGSQILSIELLNEMAKENPYTFRLVERSVDIIIKQGNAV